jgi:uncharacterized protein DUF4231
MAASPRRLNPVRKVIRGRPHQRTIETISFLECIEHLVENGKINSLHKVWLDNEFVAELDRQRALEKRYRVVFWSVQSFVLGGTVLLPLIITVSDGVPWLRSVAVSLSLAVAAATAILQVFRPGPRWRIYSYTANALSREGTMFFQSLPPYGDMEPDSRIRSFQMRTENLLRDFDGQYILDVDAILARRDGADLGDGKNSGPSTVRGDD